MAAYTVVGLGEVLWDQFPGGRQMGGAPANFAYHAHALGAESALVSQVGRDEMGNEILQRLRHLGIDTENVSVDADHPTGTVSVELDAAGKPSYDIARDVAWDYIPYSDKTRKLAGRTDAVCFGTLCSRGVHSRESIRRFLKDLPSDALRVYDINLRQNYYSAALVTSLLEHANVFKLSDDELPVVSRLLGLPQPEEQCLEALIQSFGLDVIALTRGGQGSLLYAADRASEQPSAPGDVVDTVGAGDSFTAALVMGLLNNCPLEKVNSLANRVATFVCGKPGATPELPGRFRQELSGCQR